MMKRTWLFGVVLVSAAIWAASPDPAKTAVRDIHSRNLTPASDALFAAESKPPANDKEWAQLDVSASTLIEGAGQLAALPAAKAEKKWQNLAAQLRDAAQHARVAARGRNQDALVSANGKIVETCEACHDDYRDAGHGMTSDKTPPR